MRAKARTIERWTEVTSLIPSVLGGYAPRGTPGVGGMYCVTAMSFCLRMCIGFLCRVTALEPCRTLCVRGIHPEKQTVCQTPAEGKLAVSEVAMLTQINQL